METKEHNELIAKFMGFKKKPNGKWHDVEKHYGGLLHVDFGFHHRWDWLMPVVEKIQETEDGEFLIEITRAITIVKGYETHPELYIIQDDEEMIVHTYTAVVEFIKWYNQLKLGKNDDKQ